MRLEAYSIAAMTHGVPLATAGADSCGTVGPFFLETGLSSTSLIARFWGLAEKPKICAQGTTAERIHPATSHATAVAAIHAAADEVPPQGDDGPWVRHAGLDVNAVIASAFKAAGLPAPEPVGEPGSGRVNPGGIIAAGLKAAGLTRA
jgi:hypothetical protein